MLATAALYAIPSVYPSDLNYRTILFHSFFPLAASLFGLAPKRQNMEKKVIAIISSIFLFTALCDVYLAFFYM